MAVLRGALGALLLFLPCCGMASPKITADWQGHTPLASFSCATDIIRDSGRALCEPKQQPVYDKLFCAHVYWQDDPFSCEGTSYLVHGCQPYGSCVFQVGWKPLISGTALADEVGHYVWEICYGVENTGEVRGTYTEEFKAWIYFVNARIRATCEAPLTNG